MRFFRSSSPSGIATWTGERRATSRSPELFFVLQALSGTYLGAIAAVALGTTVATLLPFSGLSRKEYLSVALTLVGAAAVLAPFAAPYLWVHRELGIEWDLPGVLSLSATPSSYLASSSHLYRALSEHLLRGTGPRRTTSSPGSPSRSSPSAEWSLSRGRRAGVDPPLLCLILVVGVLISLGPRTPFYPFLYEHVVFFRGLRALTRFGLLPLLSLSVFSAAALEWLLPKQGGLGRPRLVSAAIAFFFIAETTAVPYRLEPWIDEPPDVYRWLSKAKPGPIVELPFKVIDTQYMFWARHHGFRPMLNGDSGFVPMSHQWIKNAFARFPSPDAIALLRRLKVRYVVLHLGAFREGPLLRLLGEMDKHRADLIPVRDFGRDLVFEVVPRVSEIPARGMTAAIRLPAAGSEITIDLPGGVVLGGLRLHHGPAPRVPVERLEIRRESTSGPETLWSSPNDWPAVTELVSGLLETPRDGTQTIAVAPANPNLTGRLLLRIYGLDSQPPELTEIEVLSAAENP